ncbi:unnamed protein product [Nyctereutes procyonoides]|uniref:(raccoon dog) hypothetical protein n=1 Tax=Nyctereutes procyonoides TaxID=34880 RepID=A0A811ZHN2_NYCPR|nr:unnamed protein product [Nyctereutes procyonoides]
MPVCLLAPYRSLRLWELKKPRKMIPRCIFTALPLTFNHRKGKRNKQKLRSIRILLEKHGLDAMIIRISTVVWKQMILLLLVTSVVFLVPKENAMSQCGIYMIQFQLRLKIEEPFLPKLMCFHPENACSAKQDALSRDGRMGEKRTCSRAERKEGARKPTEELRSFRSDCDGTNCSTIHYYIILPFFFFFSRVPTHFSNNLFQLAKDFGIFSLNQNIHS